MTSEDDEIRAAVVRFYDALEAMMKGEGLDRMREAWHHTPRVTGGHPTGGWSQGWDELLATWEVFASYGNPGNGGSSLRDLRVFQYGDVAYSIGVFITGPAFGSAPLSVTNILHRADGVWKLIHHHADTAPTMGATLEKLADEG